MGKGDVDVCVTFQILRRHYFYVSPDVKEKIGEEEAVKRLYILDNASLEGEIVEAGCDEMQWMLCENQLIKSILVKTIQHTSRLFWRFKG